MEPFQIIIGAALLVVLVVVVAAVVLIRRETRSAPSPALSGSNILVAAPDQVHVYYVLNGELVLEQYRQTPGAQVQQQSIQSSQQKGASVAAGGVIGGQVGTGSTTTMQYAPTNDPVQAVGVVERHLQSEERLRSFDLTPPSDNGPIVNLLKSLESDAGRIGLTVPKEVQDDLRQAWEKHRQRIPDDLESLESLYVRFRAEFAVKPGAAEGDRILTVESHHDSGPVTVHIECRKVHVRESFPGTNGRMKAICFGVPMWDAESRVLSVVPLSIYRP